MFIYRKTTNLILNNLSNNIDNTPQKLHYYKKNQSSHTSQSLSNTTAPYILKISMIK